MGNKETEKEQTSQNSIMDSSDAEIITLRIGGKWQNITKVELEKTRKVMKSLTPLEHKVMQMYFGLPEQYFEECD